MTLSASGSPIAFYGASENIADGCNYLFVLFLVLILCEKGLKLDIVLVF